MHGPAGARYSNQQHRPSRALPLAGPRAPPLWPCRQPSADGWRVVRSRPYHKETTSAVALPSPLQGSFASGLWAQTSGGGALVRPPWVCVGRLGIRATPCPCRRCWQSRQAINNRAAHPTGGESGGQRPCGGEGHRPGHGQCEQWSPELLAAPHVLGRCRRGRGLQACKRVHAASGALQLRDGGGPSWAARDQRSESISWLPRPGRSRIRPVDPSQSPEICRRLAVRRREELAEIKKW